MDGIPLGLNTSIYHDSNKEMDLHQIIEIYKTGRFKQTHEARPNFGINQDAIWFRFVVRNSSSTPQILLLENSFTVLDSVILHKMSPDGSWTRKLGGEIFPYSDREIKSRQVVFEYLLSPGDHVFFGRIETVGPLQLQLNAWSPKEFHAHNSAEYIYLGILVGFHIVICFYNLLLSVTLKDRAYLYYVAYVFSNLAYQAANYGLGQQFLSDLPYFDTFSNIYMLFTIECVAITSLLFSSSFLDLKSRYPRFAKLYNVAFGMSVINFSISLFFSTYWGTVFCFLTASTATFFLISSGLLVSRQGYLPAKFYLVAWGFYLTGVMGTLSNRLGFIPTSLFSEWGQFTGGAIEIAILSLALGTRFSEGRRAHIAQINDLNQNLEKKVEERTSRIEALLKHIPQGILSIGQDGIVEQNYSAQLPDILGHNQIAGRTAKQIILEHTDLTEDEKDQAWHALLASIDHLDINFEINRDKLPSQLRYRQGEASKYLKLTWNTEVVNEEVTHILVTLLDVSSEIEAQEELDQKKEKFEFIRQLVEIGTSRSHQFFDSAYLLFQESIDLAKAPMISQDALKILFINIHTLKGTARSLGLRELSNELHIIETYYSQVIKGELDLDIEKVRRDLQKARDMYDRYEQIHTQVLGRERTMTTVAIDRHRVEKGVQFLTYLLTSSNLDLNAREVIEENRNLLINSISKSLRKILKDVMCQAGKIAKDLGKPEPKIHYDLIDIQLTYAQEIALRNGFIHLLRNALDHGIEHSEDRHSKNKDPIGNLFVSVKRDDHCATIYFSDDGRGLAIGNLRRRYQELGKLNSSTDIETIANLVFEQGISTADTISQVSGRGIGMGAIRQYFEGIDGSVRIILEDAIDDEKQFYKFQVEIKLPIFTSAKFIEQFDKIA
ncbi:7TM diverse intracellular signaling domain-containing protein [Pseudobacteriovorax antillogorgiicola]|nr:7TM diverse intracellular signaling domain-containing protein [Pseudobacteriovorax antillogorgiicola]